MKTRLLRTVKYATLLLVTLLVGYSCSDDGPVQQIDFNETQWEVVPITINRADWIWDNVAERYEAVVNLPEMTKFIYENGIQLGYVFIGQQGVDEVQKLLPFVHTYWEDDGQGNDILYTETISIDFMLGSPSTAAFYIQASDLGRDDSILANYNFRVVLIW